MSLSKSELKKTSNTIEKYVRDGKSVLILSKYIKELDFLKKILTKILTTNFDKITFLTFQRVTGSELHFDVMILLKPIIRLHDQDFVNCLYKRQKYPVIVDIIDNDLFLPSIKNRLPYYQKEFLFSNVNE